MVLGAQSSSVTTQKQTPTAQTIVSPNLKAVTAYDKQQLAIIQQLEGDYQQARANALTQEQQMLSQLKEQITQERQLLQDLANVGQPLRIDSKSKPDNPIIGKINPNIITAIAIPANYQENDQQLLSNFQNTINQLLSQQKESGANTDSPLAQELQKAQQILKNYKQQLKNYNDVAKNYNDQITRYWNNAKAQWENYDKEYRQKELDDLGSFLGNVYYSKVVGGYPIPLVKQELEMALHFFFPQNEISTLIKCLLPDFETNKTDSVSSNGIIDFHLQTKTPYGTISALVQVSRNNGTIVPIKVSYNGTLEPNVVTTSTFPQPNIPSPKISPPHFLLTPPPSPMPLVSINSSGTLSKPKHR
ncbi:hypothetical protein NHP190012_11850 [Helicobacter sp. NHP19-012]|uniref:Periplasmic protein n=1 Tax=Helicobacter gastrofelis TaxID=2849642 RepID=A0ABN6IBP4_9HELI|nr:hypothetical protein NHP190012_11850 [Helicobacter sp. NHP19-012]